MPTWGSDRLPGVPKVLGHPVAAARALQQHLVGRPKGVVQPVGPREVVVGVVAKLLGIKQACTHAWGHNPVTLVSLPCGVPPFKQCRLIGGSKACTGGSDWLPLST